MLFLPEELTQAQASGCVADGLSALRAESGEMVVVDAAALTRFDSSALAVLLEFRRETMVMGKQFAVKAVPPPLKNLATIYGIAELLPGI